MSKIILISSLLSMAFAHAAYADHWTPEQVQTAIRVAGAHWSGSPCQGRENIIWEASDSLVASNIMGYVHGTENCTVYIIWPLVVATEYGRNSGAWLCSVLEHEFGHLAGYYDPIGETMPDGSIDHSHSPDPNNIMHSPAIMASDCLSAFNAIVKNPKPVKLFAIKPHHKRRKNKNNG